MALSTPYLKSHETVLKIMILLKITKVLRKQFLCFFHSHSHLWALQITKLAKSIFSHQLYRLETNFLEMKDGILIHSFLCQDLVP